MDVNVPYSSGNVSKPFDKLVLFTAVFLCSLSLILVFPSRCWNPPAFPPPPEVFIDDQGNAANVTRSGHGVFVMGVSDVTSALTMVESLSSMAPTLQIALMVKTAMVADLWRHLADKPNVRLVHSMIEVVDDDLEMALSMTRSPFTRTLALKPNTIVCPSSEILKRFVAATSLHVDLATDSQENPNIIYYDFGVMMAQTMEQFVTAKLFGMTKLNVFQTIANKVTMKATAFSSAVYAKFTEENGIGHSSRLFEIPAFAVSEKLCTSPNKDGPWVLMESSGSFYQSYRECSVVLGTKCPSSEVFAGKRPGFTV